MSNRWPWSRRPGEPASDQQQQPQPPRPPQPTLWPGDAATVERWVRSELLSGVVSDDEMHVEGLEHTRVSVDLDGDDITHILIDASGIDVTIRVPESTGAHASEHPPSDPPEIVSRRPGMLRSAHLAASPITVQGYDVHLEATAADFPFEWIAYATAQAPARPESALAIGDATQPGSPSGRFSARMREADIGPLAAAIIGPQLATGGIRLRRLELDVAANRRQTVTVRGLGSVRWKFLSATVRATASVRVEADAFVTVTRVRLRTWNPIVAIALRMARSELRKIEGERHDLNAETGSTGVPRIHDLRVTVTDNVAVSGRFG